MKTIEFSEKELEFLRACVCTAADEGGPYGEGSNVITRKDELELYFKLGFLRDNPIWFVKQIMEEQK